MHATNDLYFDLKQQNSEIFISAGLPGASSPIKVQESLLRALAPAAPIALVLAPEPLGALLDLLAVLVLARDLAIILILLALVVLAFLAAFAVIIALSAFFSNTI